MRHIINNDKINRYPSHTTERLVVDGFTIKHSVEYKDQTFNVVDKRRRYQDEYFCFVEFFYVFSVFSSLDYPSLKGFSKLCMRYAKRNKTIPWLTIPLEFIVCFPVALVFGIDATTTEELRNSRPKQHLVDHEMPVICDLKNNHFHYSSKTPYWGTIFYDHFGDIIQDVLSP